MRHGVLFIPAVVFLHPHNIERQYLSIASCTSVPTCERSQWLLDASHNASSSHVSSLPVRAASDPSRARSCQTPSCIFPFEWIGEDRARWGCVLCDGGVLCCVLVSAVWLHDGIACHSTHTPHSPSHTDSATCTSRTEPTATPSRTHVATRSFRRLAVHRRCRQRGHGWHNRSSQRGRRSGRLGRSAVHGLPWSSSQRHTTASMQSSHTSMQETAHTTTHSARHIQV